MEKFFVCNDCGLIFGDSASMGACLGCGSKDCAEFDADDIMEERES